MKHSLTQGLHIFSVPLSVIAIDLELGVKLGVLFYTQAVIS